MNIEVIEAQQENRPIVRNLVSYYIYDMAEYTGWNINFPRVWKISLGNQIE